MNTPLKLVDWLRVSADENTRVPDNETRTHYFPSIAAGSFWPAGERVAQHVKKLNGPIAARTIISPEQLQIYNLRYHKDTDAQNWLIDIDADDLVSDPPSRAWIHSVKERLEELKSIAVEEELPFSVDSASAALKFCAAIRATVMPSAFLVGNGNVRLLWVSELEQIGLQFVEDELVQYVMFTKCRTKSAPHMGTDSPEVILRQISALGLRHLLGK